MPITASTQYASVLHLMDRELRQIIESQKQPDKFIQPDRSNIHKIRPAFDKSSARWQRSPIIARTLEKCRAEQDWTENLIEIECRDKYMMKAEIYTPSIKPDRGLAVILLVHGGAACMGGLGTDRFIGQLLCSRLCAIVVNIEYRLFPEVECERPFWDVYDAILWIQQNAGCKDSGIDHAGLSQGFTACGPSAGGNVLTAAMYMVAEELQNVKEAKGDIQKKVSKLDGVMMLMTGFPVEAVDHKKNTILDLYPDLRPSWKNLEEAPIMNRYVNTDNMEMSPGHDISGPLFSLLNVECGSPVLDHFPKKWYHQTAGLDMWHDTALLQLGILLHGKPEAIEKASREYMPSLPGRPCVKVDHYPGLPHTWWSVYPQVSNTEQWIEDLVAGARWTLNMKENSRENLSQSKRATRL